MLLSKVCIFDLHIQITLNSYCQESLYAADIETVFMFNSTALLKHNLQTVRSHSVWLTDF